MKVTVSVARRAKAPIGDASVKAAVAAALRGAGRKGDFEVGVVFVSDAEMTKLNARYRGKRKTTDVLSFGNDEAWPGTGERELLGDVIVSAAQAARQAKAAGKPQRQELAMLLVHGTLHLLGYDHETLKDEKVMFPLQNRILKTLRYA
ncbi:MAG TPA: rRNA maturation RNase YbeY [Patescibacteria group bacterium]|nr:rRNA maturation RNase YbeY [Patescibacteria group bacterium]